MQGSRGGFDIRKPKALREGDTIAVVAPASPVGRERLEAGAAELRRLGYRVRYRDDITAADTFFAGAHSRRAAEFLDALHDPEVAAVFCARGGYGCNYLIEHLAARGLPAEPKIVLGYSDITSLLAWLTQHAGWVTFHGPMVAPPGESDFAAGPAGYDVHSFRQAMTCTAEWSTGGGGARPLRTGTAEGVLFGGCLPMLAATLGTAREVDTAGTILLLEDIAAKPFQVDRMLFHLREAGKFERVRGIVFGEMPDCVQRPDQGYSLGDVVLRALDGVNVPIVFGFRSGHTSGGNITLPLGVRARLTAGEGVTLEMLEQSVV